MTNLVVGMGVSGLSVARHWLAGGVAVEAVDSRAAPPQREEFTRLLPPEKLRCGEAFDQWPAARFAGYEHIAVSPGVDPAVLAAAEKITNDAALFSAAWRRQGKDRARLIAVTGTNGKSTVVALAAHLCHAAGVAAAAVGNIGEPMLDALSRWRRQCFPSVVAVELSSFHLEVADDFYADAAVVLNVGGDHLDRHGDSGKYAEIKGRIYRAARRAVVNLDDAAAVAVSPSPHQTYSTHADADWSVADGWIKRRRQRCFRVADLSPACQAQLPNVLAALALLAETTALPDEKLAAGLADFPGLPHRRRQIAVIDEVRYVDDSKATNVAATIAAVESVGGRVLLIAGGDGKGQDFAPLAAIAPRLSAAVLIGRDAPQLREVLAAAGVRCEIAADMSAAVTRAAAYANAGDTVLLSPACASFDMFADYRARGAAFAAAAQALAAEQETA